MSLARVTSSAANYILFLGEKVRNCDLNLQQAQILIIQLSENASPTTYETLLCTESTQMSSGVA